MPDEFGIEDLRMMARSILRRTALRFQQCGDFHPAAVIINSDRSTDFVAFPGEFMESGRAKQALFSALAEMVRERRGLGLIIVTDSWILLHTKAQEERIFEDPAYRAALEALTHDQGVPAAAAAGYGTLAEAIICSAQTRLWGLIIKQIYRRAGADKRHIVLEGEPEELDSSSGGKLSGRMIQLYEEDIPSA